MANYVHARLNAEESLMLEKLLKVTGQSISALVRESLKFLYQKKLDKPRSALDLMKEYQGIFESGYTDLSTNKKHMEGYGK